MDPNDCEPTEEQEREQEALKRYPVLAYFKYSHLQNETLREISRRFSIFAWDIALHSPYTPETSAGLRKLLESKDCIVRANL